MLRMSYKPRTHHRDGYHRTATLDELTRNNGRDLLDVDTAMLTAAQAQVASRRVRDRYAILADPVTRAELRKFRARQRAYRVAKAQALAA